MAMKKLQHIRVLYCTAFRDASRTYERYGVRKVSKSEIPVSFIARPVFRCYLYCFACEINIKFNSTFFFFDETIQIISLKLKNCVCKLKPIIIESYTESNESLKIKRLRNKIVCSGL